MVKTRMIAGYDVLELVKVTTIAILWDGAEVLVRGARAKDYRVEMIITGGGKGDRMISVDRMIFLDRVL
jgi:hypothetical protein